MAFKSELVKWRKSTNKGALEWYQSEDFCRQYTDQELPKKRHIAYRLIKGLLSAAIIEILQRTSSNSRHSFDVLSLGCGPGSDLLGVMQVFESLESVFQSHTLISVFLNCTGVDLSSKWEQMRDSFYAQVEKFNKTSLHISTPFITFITEDMEVFVQKALADRKLYDFIILSFTDADKRVKLIGSKLPRLVRDGGRIFVIDNNLKEVKSLYASNSYSGFSFEYLDEHVSDAVLIMYQHPSVKLENRHQEVEEIDFFEEERMVKKKGKKRRLRAELQKCVKLLSTSED